MNIYQLSNADGSPYAILVEGYLNKDEIASVLEEENKLWGEDVFSPDQVRQEHAVPTGDPEHPWHLHRFPFAFGAKAVTLAYFQGVEAPDIHSGEKEAQREAARNMEAAR